MNERVQVKPNPFKKFKARPIARQETGSAETFVRYVVVKAAAQLGRAELDTARRWPGDSRLRAAINAVARAVAEPPLDLSNTPDLAVMGTDFVESLQPISAAARLFRASRLMLSFDRYAAIAIPDLIGLDEGPPAWVAPGQPAPVGELTSQGTILEPRKLEFVITVSREMILGSNAEKLIGDALRTKIAFDLDKTLFDALPGSAGRPAGLRSYNARLPESTATSGNDVMMMQDVGSLVSAAEAIAGGGGGRGDDDNFGQFYFIGRSRRIAAMRQMYKQVPPNFILLPSAAGLALPESVLLCVIPRAVPSAIGLVEVELVENAAVEMDDTPGSPDLMQARSVRSFFQSDTFGLKVRLPASWALRHPAGANWITCLWPADVGVGSGGLPDAPFDEFHYGRHQGAWEQVVEEITPAPALSGFVRWSFGPGDNAWYPVENLLAPYAPLNSPALSGSPTGPTPPNGDASNRLATTQFVTDNAGSGGGGIPDAPTDGNTYARRLAVWQQLEGVFASVNSPVFIGTPRAPTALLGDATDQVATTQFVRDNAGGVDEVPAAPNGAYARVRTNATASWQDFVTLGVAPLDNPQFTGIPRVTGPTPPVGVNSNVVATYEFVARDYLALSGGTLTGQLIAATGGVQTNVSLGFGDLQTGFYRTAGVLVCTVTGQAVVQFTPALSAFFGPVNFTNNVLSGVGDAVAAADALNLRTGDSRYLRSGGGPIIAPPGTAPTDVGLGVGDAASGLYRAGTSLAIAALGDVHMLFNANRTIQVQWPLSMNGNVISVLGDATAADHALNRRSADARYLQQSGGFVTGALQLLFTPAVPNDAVTKGYVDGVASPRAPAVLFDIPVDYPIQGDGAWHTLYAPNFPIPRGGDSLLMVSLSCNIRDVQAIMYIAARIYSSSAPTGSREGPERQIWAYGGAPQNPLSTGFTVNLYATVSGVNPTISIDLKALDGGAGAQARDFTVLGGPAVDGSARSQLCIVDLGPV